MQETYSAQTVESEVQAEWKAKDVYRAVEDALDDKGNPKPKFYVCSMLPYPSGKLHMGHVRNYTLNDVMYRYYRMKGYNVMTPMGWDAFGLPAENAAIAKNVAPADWTYANIADMKSQMEPLGLAFDWSREIATCKPDYYRWSQWMFLKMLEKGIAYRKTQTVNWDPVDMTVLANEQVIDGCGWRSGVPVEKREIPGYYLGITQYAQELLDDLPKLEGWPEQVRRMQEHWIGRSEGVTLAFPYDIDNEHKELNVYTTRADTLMGVTYVAIAAEHPLATRLARDNAALLPFIEECKKGSVSEADMATMEKKGMATGFYVAHPITGAKVEVWIANYVLMTYGEGAVMAVPAHDERDFAFAKKYNLPINQVIAVEGETFSDEAWQDWYGDKTLNATLINSGEFNGLTIHDAVDAIADALGKKNLGQKKVQFRLRDWGISRQRYWGTPIPMINCPKCGPVPVPEEDLPVVLPENLIPDGSGNPLTKCESFLNVKCPCCGGDAQRETDTMDTFVDSSWYFQRYTSPDADKMVDERNDYWMPMDQYIGGIEHAVMHLLYARFWTKVMRDLGLVKYDEPFKKLFTQGMLMADSYYRKGPDGRKTWYYPDEVSVQYDEKGRPVGAILKADGEPVELGGIEKMSKSKNNVVEPRDIIQKYGADTARSFVMFAGPPDQSAAWSNSGAEGTYRFLRRIWNWVWANREAVRAASEIQVDTLTRDDKNLRREIYTCLRQAEFDFDRLQYNTVVSACMKMFNAIDAFKGREASNVSVLKEVVSILLRTLYPIAPHITTALWDELGYADAMGALIDAPWPAVDEDALKADELKLVVQVNGKLRGEIFVPADADQAAIEAAAVANPDAVKFIADKTIRKIIVVRKKLVNIVAN